jgi:hypothetical protein
MDFEGVAKLARLAASDSSILTALQDDPARIRKPLQLSEAQVRALISAGAFSTARRARTTSEPENAVANSTELMQFGTLGTLGTLLPPEGSGAFPAPGELPPAPVAPTFAAPSHTPSVPGAPRAATPSPGNAPRSRVPAVTPAAVPRTTTPQAPSRTPASPLTPSAPRQGSGSPAVATGSTSVTVASTGPNANQQAQMMRTPGTAATGLRKASAPSSCCSCDTGMVAITAQVSTTAQATITAITAIADLD